MIESMRQFATWAPIYGSDEVVIAGHNMMQAAFAEPPAVIALRCYADLVLAIRRDLGNEETGLTANVILGMRVNDLYQHDLAPKMEMPLEQLAAAEEWPIPWRYDRGASPQGAPGQGGPSPTGD